MFTAPLVMLYCALVWGAIGVLFSFGSLLFQKDWSLLRATLEPLPTHVTWVYSPSYLGRLVSSTTRILLLTRCRIPLVYVIIWLVSHHFYKNKSKKSIKALLTTKKRSSPSRGSTSLHNKFFSIRRLPS